MQTGTLTEEGLDVLAVVPIVDSKFSHALHTAELSTTLIATLGSDMQKTTLLECLATCHSLTCVENQLVGDPLDAKMFEALRVCELDEPGEQTANYDPMTPTIVHIHTKASQNARRASNPGIDGAVIGDSATAGNAASYKLGIVRQQTFVPALQRMSVVVKTIHSDGHSGESTMSPFKLYAKGAPEMIAKLAASETGINSYRLHLILDNLFFIFHT